MTPKTIAATITQSPRLLLITATILVLLVNLLDIFTGPELSTSIFYLLPMGLVAWFISRRYGLLFAFVGAILWLATDLATNTAVSHPLIPYWNALVRLGFFLIFVWSITALKETREKEKDLISFVVHDLRTPLANMLTALELMERQTEENNVVDSVELVDIALTSGRRMVILINSLLDLARLEGGKMPVKVQQVEAHDLFNRASSQINIMARYKNISIVHQQTPEKISVSADPDLTERVLVNLLSNAIKFTPQNGSILLSALSRPDNQVLIRIQDDGPGIPIELEKQVFARFGQAAGIKNGISVGSGLGLAFCKLALEAQNGRIWLEPNAGGGTLIHFTLPQSNVIE